MDYARILYGDIAFVPGASLTASSAGIISNNGGAGLGTGNATSNSNGSSNNCNNNHHHPGSNHHLNHNHNNTNNHHNHSSSNNNINTTATNNNNHNNSGNNHNITEQFQAPKQQLCDPRIINVNWLQQEKIGGGLINVGNTCFLNSVLQCLTYCPPLYNYLVKYNGGHSKTCKINGFCMLCELEKHIKRTRFSTGNAIKPISIVQRLKYINRSFQHGRQEDAHELLRYIIDHMWKACLTNMDIKNNNNKIDSKIKETTAINHIFGGYQRSQVLCLTCKMRSDTYDYFMDLMLDIRGSKSLEDALKKYTQSETLDSDNAYRCGRCKRQVTARKRLSVYKAPNVATFQFKRFDADRIFGGKITKFISYPEELDLRPYMSDSSQSASSSSLKYQLNAVLVHIGHSSSSGHYYCFVKNSNGLWYRMDDSDVFVVNKNTVLQQQAYVLFYTRRGSDTKTMPSLNGTKEQIHASNPAISNKINNTSNSNNINSTTSNILNLSNNIKSKPAPVSAAATTTSPTVSSNGTAPPIKPDTNSIANTNGSPDKPKITSIATWSGGKSQLEEDDQSKRKLNETTERDRFNEELDQGKRKKIKNSMLRISKLHELSRNNPFQTN